MEAKEEARRTQVSRSKHKHKQEKKRRHERQIAEGNRLPNGRKSHISIQIQTVKLSELDRSAVRQVLNVVRDMSTYP